MSTTTNNNTEQTKPKEDTEIAEVKTDGAQELDKKKKKEQKKDQKKQEKRKEKEVQMQAKQQAQLQQLLQRAVQQQSAKQKETEKSHKFWDTQPVPKLAEKKDEIGPIENKTVAEIQTTPYALPASYEWYDADVDSESDMKKIYDLLYENYVEDDDSMFRFAYSVKFLKWALTPPTWRKIWHVVVRVKETGKFVAFISGIPMTMKLKDKQVNMVEINFLCVHKQLREKRLAPLLIKEITRRVNLTDIWQAVYTAGIKIPTPVSTARYYHRSLNPSKLISIKFSRIPKKFETFKDPLSMTEKYYKLPEKPETPGFRVMKESDIPEVHAQLAKFLSKFEFGVVMTQEEVKHWLMPLPNVVYSYVVEDPQTKKVTDFGSFYNLPSSVIGHKEHSELKAAYLFYYFANKTALPSLIRDLLISAKQNKFDVFNCLDIMDNSTFLEELKFGQGDGNLFYYLYNYNFPETKPNQVALTML